MAHWLGWRLGFAIAHDLV